MGNTPLFFHCPVMRRNRILSNGEMIYPPGHGGYSRTGRTKPNPSHTRSSRSSALAHEFRCQCGYVGWTTQKAVERYPVKTDTEARLDQTEGTTP